MAHLDDLAELLAGEVDQFFTDKECRVTGCTEPAATIDLVAREPLPPLRIEDTCRRHYAAACHKAGVLVRCEVIHPTAVAVDVTGAEVRQGGVVEWNPQEVRIQMNIDAGIVRLAPPAEPAPKVAGPAQG